MRKINKRIPGILSPPPKNEIDGKITNLSSKTLPQLLELRDRQYKLLNNVVFLSNLHDKGAKIKRFYNTLTNEIDARKAEEQTCAMMSNLKLNNIDKHTIQEVEWEGKLKNVKETYLDSDDDSEPEDVLHILSQSKVQEKQLKVVQPSKPLVTPEDLVKIGEVPHVRYIVDKTENPSEKKTSGQFKPYKTTKTNVHNPEKEILRKKHKHWEVTAATPPPSVFGSAKILTLDESLKLQQEYNIHLKQIEVQHAAEKLMNRIGIRMDDLPVDQSKFGKYREADSDDSDNTDCEASDIEVHDEQPERGGVIVNIMN